MRGNAQLVSTFSAEWYRRGGPSIGVVPPSSRTDRVGCAQQKKKEREREKKKKTKSRKNETEVKSPREFQETCTRHNSQGVSRAKFEMTLG